MSTSLIKLPLFPPPHLQVHVGQLILLDQVIDTSHLEPGLRLLLPLAQVDRNSQTLLGVVQRFARGSAIQKSRNETVATSHKMSDEN